MNKLGVPHKNDLRITGTFFIIEKKGKGYISTTAKIVDMGFKAALTTNAIIYDSKISTT